MENRPTPQPFENNETLIQDPSDQQLAASLGQCIAGRVGDYELFEELARGGMGVVYRARQVSLNRIVALKMIRLADFSNATDRRRFLDEAEATATLDYPNTVPIYEVGEHDGQPYYSMRLIKGGSLADSLSQGKWPIEQETTLRRGAAILAQIGRAVHDAHQHGIIHRDLKPGNILLDEDGIPYVTDFGLAKRLERVDALTRTGIIVGTPAYMAPEQATGFNITVAVDIYSLGAVLYTILTGEPPFVASTPAEALRLLLETQPQPARKRNLLVDRDLETICQKCLEKDPHSRYASALAFAEDLERWLAGDPIAARPIGMAARTYRWAKKNPLAFGVAGVAIALVGMIVGALFVGYSTTTAALDALAFQEYTNRISTAAHFYREGDLSATEVQLKAGIPDPNHRDYRGWEWNYLRRKLPVDVRISKESAGLLTHVSSSPSGKTVVMHSTRNINSTIERIVSVFELNSAQKEYGAPKFVFRNRFLLSPIPLAFANDLQNAPCISPDGSKFASQSNNAFEITNVNGITLSSIQWPTPHRETDCAWDHASLRLAMITSSGVVEIFEVDSSYNKRFELKWDSTTRDRPRVAWGPNNRWLAISHGKQTTFVDTADGMVLREWPFAVDAWNSDGTKWFSAQGFGTFESEQPIVNLDAVDLSELTHQSSWSSDGRYIAVSTALECRVIDSSTGNVEQTYLLSSYADAARFSPVWLPTNDRLLVGDAVLQDFHWTPNDREIEFTTPVSEMGLSADGKLAAITHQGSSEIRILDESGVELHRFLGHKSQVTAMDWSPNQQQIASLDTTGRLCVLDLNADSVIRQLDGIQVQESTMKTLSTDWQVRWSPEGDYLAASAGGKSVRAWNTLTWAEEYNFDGSNVRVVGWRKDPLSLISEVYSGVNIFPRKRNESDIGNGKIHSIVSWEVQDRRELRYSLFAFASQNILPVLMHDEDHVLVANARGFQFEQLETSDAPKNAKLPSWTVDHLADISTDASGLLFVLKRDGSVSVNNSKNDVLLRLSKLHGATQLHFASGRLWINAGSRIRICDGSPSGTSAAGLRFIPRSVFGNEILGVPLAMAVICPVWLLFDRGIRIAGIKRWGLAIFWCACGSAWLASSWNYLLFDSADIVLLMSNFVFAACVICESQRLFLRGNWLFPTFCLLCISLVPAATFCYEMWPSISRRSINESYWLASIYNTVDILVIGLGMAASRFLFHFYTGPRAASLQFKDCPSWVRFSLCGSKSLSDANITWFLGLSLFAVVYPALLYVIFHIRIQLPLVQISKVIVSLVFLLFPIGLYWQAAAIRWVTRRGGWDAQLPPAPSKSGPVDQ